MEDTVLAVHDFSLDVEIDFARYTAVDSISFSVHKGEILGIVGESGCGKSLTALSVQGLLEKNVFVKGGSMMFMEEDLLTMNKKRKQKINGHDISMIFQEPMTSLNPLMKIGKQIGEVLLLHTDTSRRQIHKKTVSVLEEIGIFDAEKVMDSYPHQLSGGMRQRAMIAMAVICSPRLLIADEPTTALDVTTQSHVLSLLKKINIERGTSMLFISHDLGVINRLCDRMIVMYGGKIIERGRTQDILENPLHEYTKGLIASIPSRGKRNQPLDCIPGRVPPITEKKFPCPFAPRCKRAMDICRTQTPPEVPAGEGHSVCCHLATGQEVLQ